jgi:4-hydroxy-4-methyl-2-oxoglutarate aldolase
VLVIDGKADQTAALMGTIMISACRQVGIAGVVIDGAVRDSAEMREMGFPVFSVGTNPNGPTKNGLGADQSSGLGGRRDRAPRRSLSTATPTAW